MDDRAQKIENACMDDKEENPMCNCIEEVKKLTIKWERDGYSPKVKGARANVKSRHYYQAAHQIITRLEFLIANRGVGVPCGTCGRTQDILESNGR